MGDVYKFVTFWSLVRYVNKKKTATFTINSVLSIFRIVNHKMFVCSVNSVMVLILAIKFKQVKVDKWNNFAYVCVP